MGCYWGQIVGCQIVERHSSGRDPVKGLLSQAEVPGQGQRSAVLVGGARFVSLLFEQQA
jgi:hypothetical protein